MARITLYLKKNMSEVSQQQQAVVVVAAEAEEKEIALERGNLGDDACVCMFRVHLCAEL